MKMARDAMQAAVAAACAAQRAGDSASTGRPTRSASVRHIAVQVEEAANEAVESAKDAMTAEDAGDVIGAIVAANLSAKAAQQASSLAVAAEIVIGKDRAMASALPVPEPHALSEKEQKDADAEVAEHALSLEVDRGARYLVYRNGLLLASFLREDDALLFEAELAELDVARHVDGATCEVRDRGRALRAGGYVLAGGRLTSFLRDDEHDRKYGSSKR